MQPTSRRGVSKYLGPIFLAIFALTGVFIIGVILGQEGKVSFNVGQELSSNSATNNLPVSNNLPANLSYNEVENVYDLIRKNYDGQLDQDELMDGLKRGLAEATGDPYTEFFDDQAAVAFNQQLDGTFTGIGAELGKQDGLLIVIAPLDGFPAQAAGLLPQDVIARIDGQDTTDLSVTEAVLKIRGEEGTDVSLTIVRGESEVREITITRAVIDAPSVTWRQEDSLGIIRVSRFADDTTDLTNQAASELVNSNINGIILDLRGNPGGFLNQAVSLSGLWLETGQTVVQVKRGDVVQDTFTASGNKTLRNVPTVVLINEGSASAAEILAGALQDYQLATVVGQTSFGKGSVQNLEKLPGGELLKITTARWFTPNGNNIDQAGITPDEIVELSPDAIETGADSQLDRAKEILNQ